MSKNEEINDMKALNERIGELEEYQEAQGVLIKHDINRFVKNLSPSHLLKSAIGDMGGSPEMMQSLMKNISSVVAGYVSKRMIIRRSKGLLGKLGGVFAQFGLTYLIAANADTIIDKARDLFKTVAKKVKNLKKDDSPTDEPAEPQEEPYK